MFRNQYDNDVATWSPQGRIHQIEYAMEAVKQGSATVGMKSNTHAVLTALKRLPNELSAHQKKLVILDDHVGLSIAGLTADARLLSKFMRSECTSSQYFYGEPVPIKKLVHALGIKMQKPTMIYGRRAYGVGFLIAGHDNDGPHIYQTCPSSNVYDCKAMSIGARSQSARTYMEKNLDALAGSSLEELVAHALRALRDTLPQDDQLTAKNVSVAVVGKGMPFTVYEDGDVTKWLDLISGEERRARPGAPADGPPALEGADAPAQ